MSSAEIAQLNGSFTQQAMMNQQYAGMIQPRGYNFGGYNTPAQHEGIAAKALNTSSAIGAPAAMLGMGLMGLDPLSLGVRAGVGAAGAGAGFGSAALVGAAAGGGMALGIGAITYMGNQVMQGMQQGQQFNQSMRNGYSFFNPSGTHGRGFSEGDIRSIGSGIRSQAGEGGLMELGPSFNELGRLASNMGRMGLADGVRNAKEFTEKFREMMKSVKTIAEDMGTTLEEAQKTMAAMKGSGVFKNQAGVSGAIRSASVSGGLATTEVTSMMNVGSQISRMFGGTGKQGAMGGIKAIEQVGIAQQVGALSEEDIYQATGQTGAEGRAAMAQQNMMQTGSFLKSSKGRWLMASLAGKNGTLDRGSVNDFLTGGMSVNDTRNAAHKNLAGVGRANFIRNEGRLRGAVMEEFGGMAPAMAMMGWAQGKGIDVNSMGDREMLFMQRQLGMGRDEMDSMMKMVRKMPEMLQHRREAQQEDSAVREHGLRAQNSGIEGVKRKLEAARDKVNNEMQKVGQDILNSATDAVASWGNRIAGTYEEHIIGGVREAHRAAMLGGRQGKEAVQSLLGGLDRKGVLAGGAAGSGDFSGPRENRSQRKYLDHIDDLQFSARMGSAGGMSSDLSALVKSQSSNLLKAYGDELNELGGEDRMAAFKRHFGKDTELGKKYRGMSQREQATFLQQAEGQIGIKTRISETFQKPEFGRGDGGFLANLFGGGTPGLPELIGGGKNRTEVERSEDMGAGILGLSRTKNDYDPITGRSRGQTARVLTSDESKRAQAAGHLLDDPEMRKIAFDTLRGAKGADDRMQLAIANLKGLAAERGGGLDKLTVDESGKLGALQSIQMAGELNRMDKMTPGDWKSFIAKRKAQVAAQGGDPNTVTKESLIAEGQNVYNMAGQQSEAVRTQLAQQVGRDSAQEMQLMRAGGIAKYTGKGGAEKLTLTDETRASLMKGGGKGAVQAAEMALEVQKLGKDLGNATTDEERKKIAAQMYDKQDTLADQMAGMDVKSLRAFGASMAGTQLGGKASEMIMRGQAIEGGKRKGGAAGAIANQLGLQLSAEDIAGLKGKSASAGAAAIAARLGVSGDDSFTKGLEEAIAASAKKGGGIQGGALLQRALEGAGTDTKKKLEEMAKGQQSPDEKIIDKIGEGNKYLEALVKSTDAGKASLARIANNSDKKDPEKDPPK